MGKLQQNKGKFSPLDFITKWGTLLTILVLILGFSAGMPTTFPTLANLITIVRAVCVVTIIAIGMTLSLTVNGMDLSVGSTASLANTVCMTFFVWYGMGSTIGGTLASILLTILICLVVAVANAILIVKFKIPDMLATLATMFMFEGVAMTYAGGGAINENMSRNGQTATGKVPEFFRVLGKEPWIIIIMLVVVFVVFVFLSYTKHGRYMYAVGTNPEAARLTGINVKKYRALAYVLSTILAAVGGMLIGARVGNAQINSGATYLMGSVAAANIGMSVAGIGRPNAIGTLVGAVLIGVLENGLIMASVPYYAVNIFKGAILAIALALNYARKKQ